jgi:hypothetical protein
VYKRQVKNSASPVSRKVPLYKKDDAGNYIKDDDGRMVQEGWKFKEEVGRFSPQHAVEDHRRMLGLIKTTIELRKSDADKFVVVGHHSPSKQSTHPRYKHETLMNGGYSSDLEEFIKDRPQIKLWTHGHTHEDFDYMVGETRIVCNPRGYIGYEGRADNFKLKVVEV